MTYNKMNEKYENENKIYQCYLSVTRLVILHIYVPLLHILESTECCQVERGKECIHMARIQIAFFTL